MHQYIFLITTFSSIVVCILNEKLSDTMERNSTNPISFYPEEIAKNNHYLLARQRQQDIYEKKKAKTITFPDKYHNEASNLNKVSLLSSSPSSTLSAFDRHNLGTSLNTVYANANNLREEAELHRIATNTGVSFVHPTRNANTNNNNNYPYQNRPHRESLSNVNRQLPNVQEYYYREQNNDNFNYMQQNYAQNHHNYLYNNQKPNYNNRHPPVPITLSQSNQRPSTAYPVTDNNNHQYPHQYESQFNNSLDPIGNSLSDIFRHFGVPGSQLGTQLIKGLENIARNDDLQCVPKVLCQIIGNPARRAQLPGFLSSPALASLINALPAYSPAVIFGRAALLGFSGGEKGCDATYAKCPQNEEDILYYLNNHKGGFFKFFGDASISTDEYYLSSSNHQQIAYDQNSHNLQTTSAPSLLESLSSVATGTQINLPSLLLGNSVGDLFSNILSKIGVTKKSGV